MQLAEGLAAAHEQGVAHRDLKPGNLRITPDERLKILDFGLAKLLQPPAEEAAPTKTLTETQAVAGTLPYMAPEQLRGERVDSRTDIYAMGVVLYEMATGERPFRDELAPRLIDAIFHQPAPSPQSVNPKVTPDLERIILKCLEKEPENRYQSPREIVVDLRRLRRDSDSMVATVTAEREGRAGARVPRRYWHGALAALLVALAGAGLYFRLSREKREVRAVIAALEPAVTAGRLDEVFAKLQEAGVDLDDAGAESLAKRVGGSLSVTSDPSGATVTARRVTPLATFSKHQPIHIGRTPVDARLVAGEYLVRLGAEGSNPAEVLATLEPAKVLRVSRKLLAAGKATDGMVLVEEENTPSAVGGKPVPAFLIGRHEVTNEQFLKFVAAGGYRDRGLWPQGAPLHSFVDRAGVPGPRAWSGGVFPQGKADHPVAGVSWYEAAAYARWAGKELPTKEQWWRAALGSTGGVFPWGRDVKTTDLRANFGMAGTRSVGSYPAGISPFGCYDMAGNVREWLRGAAPDDRRRIVAGGSWEDPTYMFDPSHAEAFDPVYASEAIGFRLVMAAPAGP